MFDVSFTEMLVIAVVALVVIGPERLPKVARTVGHLLGRAQRYVSDVKGDIRREMELDELRNLRSEMEEAARTIKSTVDTNVEEMRKELDHTTREVKSLADDAAHSASTASAAADAAVHGGDAAFPPEGVTGAPHVPDAIAAVPNPAITPRDLPPGAPQVTPDPIVTLHADAASAPSGEPVPQASLFPSDVLPPVAAPVQADVAPAVADAGQATDTHPAATPAARDREKA